MINLYKIIQNNFVFVIGLGLFISGFILISTDSDAKNWTGPSTLTVRLIFELVLLLGAIGYLPLFSIWNMNILDKKEAKKKVIPSGLEYELQFKPGVEHE